MAIRKNFGGASILVPGAYDKASVITTGSAPSIAVGKIALIGEALKGEPGVVKEFSPDALKDLIAEYGSGPLVDAAMVAVAPSNDARIVQGASSIYCYKTNPSTKASLVLANSWGSFQSLEYGEKANLIYSIINKSNTVDASITSSASFDSTSAISAGFTFDIIEKGAIKYTFMAPSGIVSRATFLTSLQNVANWSPALPPSIVFSFSGASDAAALMTISMIANANDHRLGASRVFELEGANLSIVHISPALEIPSIEPSIQLQVVRQLDGIIEDTSNANGNLGGVVMLEVGCDDSSCSITIDDSYFSTTAASKASLHIKKSDFVTLADLAQFISAQVGYSCVIPEGVNPSLSPDVLDRVAALGCASVSNRPARIKADSFSVFDYVLKSSSLIEVINDSTVGLPDPMVQSFLSGAVRGASSNAEFINGLSELEAIDDIDLVVPLVSQDALDDLAEDMNYTDVASSYTAKSILLATKDHCKKMAGVKARKERACYLGFRESFSKCKIESMALGSEVASLLIEDIQIVGSDGNLKFVQPHISAAICAAMQAGAEIGQPTTKKAINAVARRHVGKQGIKLSLSETFSSKTMADQAIEAGILPLNINNGRVEIVVQNSTYSKDDNFVYNRPSVLSAANYVRKSLRSGIENIFVGEKMRTSTKSQVQSYVETLMAEFVRPGVDIIVGDDTNGGLGYKNLVLRVVGNTLFIDITITVVQGVDFILSDINIDNIRISK